MAHMIEWDILVLKPLNLFFKKVKTGVALSNVETLERRMKSGWVWVSGQRSKEEFFRLKKFVQKEFGWKATPLGGLFPLASMSKEFLKRYSKVYVPSFCNDEVRLPIFAQSFKMRIHDIPLKDKSTFNCDGKIVSPESVYEKAAKGNVVFHPVRDILDIKRLLKK